MKSAPTFIPLWYDSDGSTRAEGAPLRRADMKSAPIPTSQDAFGASVRQRECQKSNGWVRGRGRLAGRHDPPYILAKGAA